MAAILGFGAYLPSRVVTNAELAARLNCEPGWILDVSGIEERRYAAPEESVASMGVAAARAVPGARGVIASEVGMILVSSGSSERRFPGPASAIAHALGIDGVPAIDLPIASAGGLFGMALAAAAVRDSRQHSGDRVRENVGRRYARTDGARRCAPVRRRRRRVPDRS